MGQMTAIAWTDSTFNPWIGCTKVGPGCDHCYAEALDKRHRWGGDTHWGAGKERKRTSPAYWRQPHRWNKKALESGKPWRVFCASLADVFDNEVPASWRWDLWDLISETPYLTWLLLTKRIGNAAKMLPTLAGEHRAHPNVWLGATIVNQEEADRDVPKLLETRADVRFVSYEPALGPVDWTKFPGIDWLIIGGESTQGAVARPFSTRWALHTIHDCKKIGAVPFVKQLGSAAHIDGERLRLKDRAGADPAEWPVGLRVQEFPA